MIGSPAPEDRTPSAGDSRWRPAASPLAFWALLFGGLAGLQAAFGGHLLPVLVQAGGAALIGAIALAIFLSPIGRRRPATALRAVPDLSIAAALAGVSLAAMLAGAAIGTWLIIGGGLGLAAALGGLLRERRAEQRSRLRAGGSLVDPGPPSETVR